MVGILEVVITACVDHGGRLRLRGGKAFSPVMEKLRAQLQLLAQHALHHPRGIGEVAVVLLRDNLVSAATVEGPGPDVFLQPEGQFVPDLSHAEAPGVTACGHLKHGEAADLGNVWVLLDESDLGAQFHIGEAESAGPGAAWQIDGIVGGRDLAPGQDGMKLNAGNHAPVELEGRADGVDLCGGSIDAAEDVELVMAVVDRDRIVGLERRALRQ